MHFKLWLEEENFKDYNNLLDQEVKKLPYSDAHAMLGTNWVGEIRRAIIKGGVRDKDDIDDMIQKTIMSLLVENSGLFKKYNPQEHGSFKLRWGGFLKNLSKMTYRDFAKKKTRFQTNYNNDEEDYLANIADKEESQHREFTPEERAIIDKERVYQILKKSPESSIDDISKRVNRHSASKISAGDIRKYIQELNREGKTNYVEPKPKIIDKEQIQREKLINKERILQILIKYPNLPIGKIRANMRKSTIQNGVRSYTNSLTLEQIQQYIRELKQEGKINYTTTAPKPDKEKILRILTKYPNLPIGDIRDRMRRSTIQNNVRIYSDTITLEQIRQYIQELKQEGRLIYAEPTPKLNDKERVLQILIKYPNLSVSEIRASMRKATMQNGVMSYSYTNPEQILQYIQELKQEGKVTYTEPAPKLNEKERIYQMLVKNPNLPIGNIRANMRKSTIQNGVRVYINSLTLEQIQQFIQELKQEGRL